MHTAGGNRFCSRRREAGCNATNSTATDAAGLVTDFNALLAKLKAAGIMA
ncbi:head fiber protein [Serratia marcescens]